ncbi:hypothetical protein CW749_14195 [Vibrio sp. vnigr-6D03]|uniref:aldehyde dehydrogenase family protein n=1 Tax=Vibrio sp. vnigr-6D03 TaxID=2058088 RepID=UPI000C31CF81|nr:aldehyde dehydrogenase family protein [Vibrio sp. vnigr-6D03]PKF79115.1 hypothetical protein CW749_14195 [Vibrio sp. vnigr-6D03]
MQTATSNKKIRDKHDSVPSWVKSLGEKWWNSHCHLVTDTLEHMREGKHWQPFSDSLEKLLAEDRQIAKDQLEELTGKYFFSHGWGHELTIKRWFEPEKSPYGKKLGIKYPIFDPNELCENAITSMHSWKQVSKEYRAGILLEALVRLNEQSSLLAEAGIHTSGHSYLMGFHANAVHAQYRGIEAVTRVFEDITNHTRVSDWDISIGDGPKMGFHRAFERQPVGINLVICGKICPTWSSYAAVFSSLMAGNPVIVKPHPEATLPMALTVKVLKYVMEEAGLDPSLVSMLSDDLSGKITRELAVDPRVKIIDYTGRNTMANWLVNNAQHARLFIQSGGVTPVVLDSTSDFQGMIRNLSFGFCSYSSQLCTSPRALFIPNEGVSTPERNYSFEEVINAIKQDMVELIQEYPNPSDILGAVYDESVIDSIEKANAKHLGKVLRLGEKQVNPDFPTAEVWSPVIVLADESLDYRSIPPTGPIILVFKVDSKLDVGKEIQALASQAGCLSIGLYSYDESLREQVSMCAGEMGAVLSIGFVGNYFLSQSEVFTDCHGSNLVNASYGIGYSEQNFYTSRMRTAELREQVY